MLFVAASSELAAQGITIQGLSRTRTPGWVFVDNGWARGLNLIEVRFRVDTETPGNIPLQYGFFDSGKKLLGKFEGLPRLEVKEGTYQSLPKLLEPNHLYSICLPIPPSLSTGSARWQTLVVELGSPPGVARAVYPADANPADFSLATNPGASVTAAGEIKPVIKRIESYRNGQGALVDGKWIHGLETLKVTVRVDSGAEACDFWARAYLYDANGKGLFRWGNPPQVTVTWEGDSVTLPGVWKNGQTYDLRFPIPPKYEQGSQQCRSAIIVFGDAHAAAVQSYPIPGKTADFDFPEKGEAVAQ